ncbi:hypothetical protein IFM89_031015 [Coptis chinensis]|uniref:Uncharacterized protein n=1 Tax=Coptis chinensis TaxID=261450 RepID=A0A835LG94_9MAGN|nr:hypothetical protein IFM89_031015 [Coptis chinensis]
MGSLGGGTVLKKQNGVTKNSHGNLFGIAYYIDMVEDDQGQGGKEKDPNLLCFSCKEENHQNQNFSKADMVDVWWSLLGATVPALVTAQALRMKRRRAEEQRIKSARGREKSSDDVFVCERVCTSKRMLKRVGAFSKDPTPDTCVTVCGVSELDACSDACARTVCVNQHQVPNWNDICLRRCQSECLKLSSSYSS